MVLTVVFEQMQHAFESRGYPVDTIRIIYDRATGRPKGFAFVTLASAEAAERFMRNESEALVTGCGKTFPVEYSKTSMGTEKDLICQKCRSLNFGYRSVCYRCADPITVAPSFSSASAQGKGTHTLVAASSSRSENPIHNTGRDDVTSVPSNVLILLDLPPLTSEEIVSHIGSNDVDVYRFGMHFPLFAQE